MAILLMVLVFTASTPAAISASFAGDVIESSTTTAFGLWPAVIGWVRKRVKPQEQFGRGVKPNPPQSKAEKEARVARLQINPSGNVFLQSQQPMWFTAVPFDQDGSAIHGLQAEWESSDRQVIFTKKTGQALAGKPGSATLTARAGSLTATVHVIVAKGNGKPFGGKKDHDSTRRNRQSGQLVNPPANQSFAQNMVAGRKHNHIDIRTTAASRPPVPLRDPDDDPLPDNETNSLYQVANSIGSLPGKKRAGAPKPGVAGDTGESGNKNFSFALPLVNLPGRGLDVSLSLVYNSDVWNKSTDGSSTWMTYDVDSSWPATGWRITLGQIEDQGSYGFTLTDMDGTRHALTYTSAYNYDTTDGSFIHYYGGAGWGTLYYPDGTVAYYGAGGGGYRVYPTEIVDRNGNCIVISYAGTNGTGPKISSIEDTLARYIHFDYASNGDLVAITQPGISCSGCPSDPQTMRFYYTDVTIASGLFATGINVAGPSSVHTLQYVYLPTSSESSGAHTGYQFDYSPYGMVSDIKEYRGMTASSTSTSTAGTVSTSSAAIAARTTYEYPSSAQGLSDVPTYSTRTDEWAGRTTGGSAPSYSFSTNESTGVSTVTAPDGTVSETDANPIAGQWYDGLVTDTYVKDSSTPPTTYTRTHLDWQQDSNSRNPRVYQIITTDVAASLSKATVLTYTTYNNISAVSERDFGGDATTPYSTEVRRTETTYVTSSSYIDRHLLHLPSTIKVFPGGSNTPASRVDYAYDDYGTSHANLTARDDILMHLPAYDPFQQTQEINCRWECWDWEGEPHTENYYCADWEWVCDEYNPYDSSTDYRGNVTSVTTYIDAGTPSGSITHSTTYDIAGNVTTAQVDCCQLKTISYTDNPNTHTYAYPVSVTSGNASGVHTTSSATYDFNTGLVGTTTDENGQDTTNYYNSESLRLEHVTYPGSAATYFTYSDGLNADGASSYHYYVKTSTKLDANGSGGATRYVDSYRYFDGRGAVARTMNATTSSDGFMTQDVQYDAMGRAHRSSNPYYASGYSSTPLSSSSMFWTTSTFDHLGRVTQLDMPRGDDDNSLITSVTTSYDGVYTTVTDQAGKERRQKVDALGRVIRLDEPTTSGLGTYTSPNQLTSYEYDVLDNLVHINQGSQDRYFKYDSLSRMIRERQVEQTVNSSYNLSDSLTGNSSWNHKIDYNSSGLVTDTYDARGVHATLSYDDLNRVTQISYSDSTPTAHYYYDSQSLPTGAPSTSSPDSFSRGYSAGRLVAVTYGSGATGTYFGYDSTGHVVQQFQLTGSTPAKYKLIYYYNYAGMLTHEIYPSGRDMAYSYDDGGRLSQMSDGTNTFASSFTYAAHGGLTSETWGNTAVHTMSYNRRLQASQVKLAMGSTPQQQYDYEYGQFNTTSNTVDTSKNNGQIGRIIGTIGSTAQWNQILNYDELGRLSSVNEHQGSSATSTSNYSQGYTYDRYGNRFQNANSPLGLIGVSSSEIDASTNRFINSGSTPTTYDAAGNITVDTKFRNLNYGYDANGRMTSAASNDYNIGSQSSVYDCTGQRVQTTANNVTRTMVYDVFGQLVADYLGSSGSTLERENIYRGGQLLAVYETGASCTVTISGAVDSLYSGVHYTPSNGERDNSIATMTQAQAQGQTHLIAAAKTFGESLFSSSNYNNSNSNAQYVTDLYIAYLGRDPNYLTDPNPQNNEAYGWVHALDTNSASRADVRNGFAYSSEFQNRAGGACPSTSSTSASIKYVLTDAQGTTRTVMNNNNSSSTVISRHDSLPFGEELWAGIGSRLSSQAYGATDAVRGKYGLTERDDATGLDHAWWRKYESLSGRWLSPDPYQGSMTTADPQSFNRYSYVENDSVNFVDPTGLLCWAVYSVTTITGLDKDNRVIFKYQEWEYLYTYCDHRFSSPFPRDVFRREPQTRFVRSQTQIVTQQATPEQVRKQNLKNCLSQANAKSDKAMMAELNRASNPLNVDLIGFTTGVGLRTALGASVKSAGAGALLGSQATKGVRAYWAMLGPTGFGAESWREHEACHELYGY